MAELKGMREALEALRKLPDHVAPRGGGPINRALFKSVKPWQEDATRNASSLGPGNHQRGNFSIVGRLKDNIVRKRDSEPEVDGHYARVFVTTKPHVYWDLFVEVGTEKQDAQPFMRPAFEANKDKAQKIFRKALWADIDRIAKRLAK